MDSVAVVEAAEEVTVAVAGAVAVDLAGATVVGLVEATVVAAVGDSEDAEDAVRFTFPVVMRVCSSSLTLPFFFFPL